MQKKRRVRRVLLICLAVVLAVFLVLAGLAVYKLSCYGSRSDVVVADKGRSIWGHYYITIQEGPTLKGKYKYSWLRCTEEQYLSVEVGETIDCSRTVSGITHRGVLNRIE